MSKISMPVLIDLEDLAISLNNEDGIKLIKMIDDNMEDWGFTKECFEHFANKLHSQYYKYSDNGESINNLLKEVTNEVKK